MKPKNYLTQMRIKEVSFVDKGANRGAHILFYKRDDVNLDTITKYQGELVSALPAATQKVYSSTFANMLVQEDKMSGYYKLLSVLSNSVRSICEDMSIDDSVKGQLYIQTLNEFYNAATSELVAKAKDEKFSITDSVISAPGTASNAENNATGGSMTKEQDLEKRVGELEEVNKQLKADNAKLTEANKALDSKLNKAGDKEGDACMVDGKEGKMSMDGGKLVCMSKADLAKRDAVPEAVQKRLDEQETEITKMREDRELADFTKRAEGFSRLATTPAKLAPLLRKISKALTPEENGELERVLKAAHESMRSLMIQKGSDGSGSSSAFDSLNAKAVEISKADNISKEKGFQLACERNPELYEQYQADRKSSN